MIKLLPLISLFIISISASADSLIVVGKVGNVVDAKPYYQRFLESSKGSANQSPVLTKRDKEKLVAWAGKAPFKTTLKLGKVKPTINSKTAMLFRPMCIIANNKESKHWLLVNKNSLFAVKPVCYMAEYTSDKDIAAIKTVIPNLEVIASNPTFFITTFNLTNYPVLITKKGIQ